MMMAPRLLERIPLLRLRNQALSSGRESAVEAAAKSRLVDVLLSPYYQERLKGLSPEERQALIVRLYQTLLEEEWRKTGIPPRGRREGLTLEKRLEKLREEGAPEERIIAELPPEEREARLAKLWRERIAQEIRERPLRGPATEVPTLRDYYTLVFKRASNIVDRSLYQDFARRGILDDYFSTLRLAALEAHQRKLPSMGVVVKDERTGKLITRDPLRSLLLLHIVRFLRGYGYPTGRKGRIFFRVGERMYWKFGVPSQEEPIELPASVKTRGLGVSPRALGEAAEEEEAMEPRERVLTYEERGFREAEAAKTHEEVLAAIKAEAQRWRQRIIVGYQTRVEVAKQALSLASLQGIAPGEALRVLSRRAEAPHIRRMALQMEREAAGARHDLDEYVRQWGAHKPTDVYNNRSVKATNRILNLIERMEKEGRSAKEIIQAVVQDEEIKGRLQLQRKQRTGRPGGKSILDVLKLENPDLIGAIFGGFGSGIGLGIAFPTVSHVVKGMIGVNNHNQRGKEAAMVSASTLANPPRLTLAERKRRALLNLEAKERENQLFARHPQYRRKKRVYLKRQFYSQPDLPRSGTITGISQEGGFLGLGGTLYLRVQYVDAAGRRRSDWFPAAYFQLEPVYTGGFWSRLFGQRREPPRTSGPGSIVTGDGLPLGIPFDVQPNPPGTKSKRRPSPFNQKTGELMRKYLAQGMDRKAAFRRAVKEASSWLRAQRNPRAGGKRREVICPACAHLLIVRGHGEVTCPAPGCGAQLKV